MGRKLCFRVKIMEIKRLIGEVGKRSSDPPLKVKGNGTHGGGSEIKRENSKPGPCRPL
jgi:hypothetical protein